MNERLFSLSRALADKFKISFAESEDSNIIGLLTSPDNQEIPIFLIDDLPVLIPNYSGFDSMENAIAFPAKTSKPLTNSNSEIQSFPSLHLGKLLLHLRLFHAAENRVERTAQSATDAPKISKNEKLDPHCEACLQGGMHHTAVLKHRQKSNPRKLRLLHTDWWGPFPHPGKQHQKFIQVFIDDISGYVWTFSSRRKD